LDLLFILGVVAALVLVFGTFIIWGLMGFYSVRILKSFRGGVLSRGWKYISIAVPFLISGQLMSGLGNSQSLAMTQQEILRVVGMSLSAIGGLLIVVGFRAQYQAWNPKGMKSGQATPESRPIGA
jgi:hypothetical protein